MGRGRRCVDARDLVGRRQSGSLPERPAAIVLELASAQRALARREDELNVVGQSAHLAGLEQRTVDLGA